MPLTSTRKPVLALTALALLLFSAAYAQAPGGPFFVQKQLTGLAWNGKDFIASYGEFTSYLLNVSITDKTVAPFAPSFSGQNETYIAIGDGSAGFPKGMLYVSSLQSIYRVSSTGDNFSVFSTPPGASRIGYLAFDRVGTWGRALFAVDDNGLLWSVAANGTAKVIENFGAHQKPEGITVAPTTFGGYGGYLFVSLEYGKSLVAIAPNDTSKVITVTQFPSEAPERVLTIPSNSDLFVAKWIEGTVISIPAANMTKYAGALLIITEGDAEANGSIMVATAAGRNLTETVILHESDHPHFEGADFVPSQNAQSSTNAAATGSGNENAILGSVPLSTTTALVLVATVALLAVGAVAFLVLRRRQSLPSEGRRPQGKSP